MGLGKVDGALLGCSDVTSEGLDDGTPVGLTDGLAEGCLVGNRDGISLGAIVGGAVSRASV